MKNLCVLKDVSTICAISGKLLNFHARMLDSQADAPLKIKQERKPLCYHFCLNSFCLHLPISFMNMEGICGTLVFVGSLSLTPNVSC